MDLTAENQRNTENLIETRLVAYVNDAHHRLGHGASASTQDLCVAESQDLALVPVDALSLQPRLVNPQSRALMVAVSLINANITRQMQQMNENIIREMQQMHENITRQLQQAIDSSIRISEKTRSLTRRITANTNENALFRPGAFFIPYKNANGVIPKFYPRDKAALAKLTGPQMRTLLQAYNVNDIPRAIEDRRARVRQLIITGI